MFRVKIMISTVLRLKGAAVVHFELKCNRTYVTCLCLVNLLFFSHISYSWGFTGSAPPFTPHPPHHPPPLSSLFLFLSFTLWNPPVWVPTERKQRRRARRSCKWEEGSSSNIRSFLFKIFNSKPSALPKQLLAYPLSFLSVFIISSMWPLWCMWTDTFSDYIFVHFLKYLFKKIKSSC